VITRSLEKCALNIGLDVDDVHPHLLRHTYATRYYEACQDPKKLQDHMSWANIATAMNYVGQSSREELDAIADAMFD
jgi:integrase